MAVYLMNTDASGNCKTCGEEALCCIFSSPWHWNSDPVSEEDPSPVGPERTSGWFPPADLPDHIIITINGTATTMDRADLGGTPDGYYGYSAPGGGYPHLYVDQEEGWMLSDGTTIWGSGQVECLFFYSSQNNSFHVGEDPEGPLVSISITAHADNLSTVDGVTYFTSNGKTRTYTGGPCCAPPPGDPMPDTFLVTFAGGQVRTVSRVGTNHWHWESPEAEGCETIDLEYVCAGRIAADTYPADYSALVAGGNVHDGFLWGWYLDTDHTNCATHETPPSPFFSGPENAYDQLAIGNPHTPVGATWTSGAVMTVSTAP